MAKQINRRQKPVWKSVRKPIAPPTRVQPTKKEICKRKKDKDWQKELEEIEEALDKLRIKEINFE